VIFGNPRKPIFKARKKKPRVSRVKVNVTHRNIEALNNEMEQAVRMDFIHGINGFKKKIPKAKMDAAFNARGYEGLRSTVPYKDLDKSMARASRSLAKVVDETVAHTIKGITGGVHDENLSMTSSNPRLQQSLDARKKKYLKDLEREHHAHMEHTVKEAMLRGHDSQKVAASVRDGLGLNARQARAFEKYKESIAGMPTRQRAKLEKDYYNRAIDYRANMIAVTEVRNASANAQLETYKFAEETGLMAQGSRKRWVIGAEDACDKICYPMDGEEVGLHESWTLPNGDTVDIPAATHPHCRCSYMIITDDDADNDPYTEQYTEHT
jgi:hypothetical protein